MYKSIFLVLIMLLAVGCTKKYPSYGIPRSPDALQAIHKYKKIHVALVEGKLQFIGSRNLFVPPISGFDRAIPFTLDSSEVSGGNKTLSPNVPFTNNFTQHVRSEVEGLEIQTHKGLDLSDWKNREMLIADGLWLQSYFHYNSLGDVFDYIYILRGSVYLVASPSKKILWQGACRKWVYVEEKYMSLRKEVLKIKLNSFIKSCSSDLIAQWSGIKNTENVNPQDSNSQKEYLFNRESVNDLNDVNKIGISVWDATPVNELDELTFTEEAELKKLL